MPTGTAPSRADAARLRTDSWPPSASRLGPVLFATAAVLFVVYPALRPYSSEVGMDGAAAFGTDRWVLAHVAGMAAFGCLAAGCYLLFAGSRLASVSTTLGVGLILPYYGAEAFGLHAIGDAAAQYGSANLAATADAVRYNPVALAMFTAGWIALAVAGVALMRTLWARRMRTGGVLVGAGLVLYLPQFFGPPWLRILHGATLAVGLVIVAIQSAGRPTHG